MCPVREGSGQLGRVETELVDLCLCLGRLDRVETVSLKTLVRALHQGWDLCHLLTKFPGGRTFNQLIPLVPPPTRLAVQTVEKVQERETLLHPAPRQSLQAKVLNRKTHLGMMMMNTTLRAKILLQISITFSK